MRAREHAHWRGGIYLGVAATIAAFTLVVLSPAAFAHANIVSGIANCGSPTSTTYQITWSITNDWNLPETVQVTAASGGLGTLDLTSLKIPASGNGSGGAGRLPFASVTLVQTLWDSETGLISIDVASTYSDGFTTSNSGEVASPTDCAPIIPTTTLPPPPTSQAPVIAAATSPTTIPAAAPTTTVPAPTIHKIARSGNSAKRPTLLANALPRSKPVVPITKTATFTG